MQINQLLANEVLKRVLHLRLSRLKLLSGTRNPAESVRGQTFSDQCGEVCALAYAGRLNLKNTHEIGRLPLLMLPCVLRMS
jgi:hypothetical protein